MYYKLVGSKYVIVDEAGNLTGNSVTLQEFPFVAQVGDLVERYGQVKTVSNVIYMENGSVILEMSSVEEGV